MEKRNDKNQLIEAGPGKIKKRRKRQLVTYASIDNTHISPYKGLSEFQKDIASVRKSDTKVQSGIFENTDVYTKIGHRLDRFWLINLDIIEELFQDSRYIKQNDTNDQVYTYRFVDIPNFPQIEFAEITLPIVNNEYEKGLRNGLENGLTRYLRAAKLVKIWKPLQEYGPDLFNILIYFQAPKKTQVRHGLYIPLIADDSKVPEEKRNNFWHIFYAKFFKENAKSELYYHETIDRTLLNCHGHSLCTPDLHFKGCFEDAIQKYGGREQ